MKPNYVKGICKILKKTSITDYLIEITITLDQKIEWIPGQFINLNVGENSWRSYSILKYEGDEVTLFVDLRPDGVGSKFLKNVKENEKVNYIGPFGRFTIQNLDNKKLFVATGTGIAPIIPMIKQHLASNNDKEIILLYGVRFDNEGIIERYLSSDEISKIKLVRCITQTEDTNKNYKGRVTEYLKENFESVKDYDVYICGNPNMVVEAIEIAKRKEVENIFTEKY